MMAWVLGGGWYFLVGGLVYGAWIADRYARTNFEAVMASGDFILAGPFAGLLVGGVWPISLVAFLGIYAGRRIKRKAVQREAVERGIRDAMKQIERELAR